MIKATFVTLSNFDKYDIAYLGERDDRDETNDEFDLLRPVGKVTWSTPNREYSDDKPLS